MHPYASLCVLIGFMRPHGSLCVLIGFYGFLCVLVGPYYWSFCVFMGS